MTSSITIAAVGQANAGLAQLDVVDAVRIDDVGLAEVALEPVEGRRRDRDAVAGADALVPVDPHDERHQACPSGRAEVGRSRRREPAPAADRQRGPEPAHGEGRGLGAIRRAEASPGARPCGSRSRPR